MGRRSSLHEVFVRVKTPMGLEQFEVRFFFAEKNETLQFFSGSAIDLYKKFLRTN